MQLSFTKSVFGRPRDHPYIQYFTIYKLTLESTKLPNSDLMVFIKMCSKSQMSFQFLLLNFMVTCTYLLTTFFVQILLCLCFFYVCLFCLNKQTYKKQRKNKNRAKSRYLYIIFSPKLVIFFFKQLYGEIDKNEIYTQLTTYKKLVRFQLKYFKEKLSLNKKNYMSTKKSLYNINLIYIYLSIFVIKLNKNNFVMIFMIST